MKYSQKIYEKAIDELSRRRRAAELIRLEREEFVRKNIPEYDRLRLGIENSYLELTKLIASHSPDAHSLAQKTAEKNTDAQRQIREMVYCLTGKYDFLNPPYNCAKCKDTGYSEGKRCLCLEKLLRKYAVEELNQTSAIKLHDFEEFDLSFYDQGSDARRMEIMLKNVRNYCARFPENCGSLLFIGKTGLGKTFLSSCMAKAIAEKGALVALGTSSELFRRIEKEHFNNSDGGAMDALLTADFLIIDDLGSEFKSAFYESVLYNILSGRLNLNRPTLISTNLDENSLGQRYNDRIISRIFGDFEPNVFLGRDIRQQKALRRNTY